MHSPRSHSLRRVLTWRQREARHKWVIRSRIRSRDATLQATCAESWVSNLSTATEGLITFEVAANETTEAREAVVKVQYGDIQQFGQFTIKQAREAGG